MAEPKRRYVVVHREGQVDREHAAEVLGRAAEMLYADVHAAHQVPGDQAAVHFSQIGVSYAWFTAAEVGRLMRDDRISSVREHRRVSAGGTLVSVEKRIVPPPAAAEAFALPPLPATIPWNVKLVGADQIWGRTAGQGVKVAVLDNGINKHRADLVVVGGVSFVPNITDYDDDDGHGTHCAGIIAARASASGVVGVAYDCSLYAVKVMTHGSGDTDWLVAGMLWAADNHMDVVSMSLWKTSGADAPDEAPWEDVQRAAQRLLDAGCLVAGIAGNSGDRPNHWVTNPGRCPAVVAAGAIDSQKAWWNESSYGPPTLPVEQAVEVTAPGVMVRSTYLGDQFAVYNGTSMACPHVAGAAALIKGLNPTWTPAKLRERLRSTAADLGPPGPDEKFGGGLLDCLAAAANPAPLSTSTLQLVKKNARTTKSSPKPKRKTPPPRKPGPRWIAAGAIVLAIAAYGLFWWAHRNPSIEVASFENGLRALGYSAFQPPRDDLMPGSVIHLDPVGQELVLAGANLELPALDPEPAHSVDQTWRVKISADGKASGRLPGIVGNLSGLDVSEAQVTLKNVTIRRLPLKTLSDAVHAHPKSLSANALKNPAVVIVSEVLIAGTFECDFRNGAKAHIDLSQKGKDLDWAVESGFKVSADGKLVSERPMPLGFKCHPITSKGLDYAPTDFVAKVGATEFSGADVDRARQAATATGPVRSEYQVFAFCFGLGDYRPAALEGAAPSAERVADELRKCLPAEFVARVEAYTTRPSDGATAGTVAISRAQILQRIDEFVARNRPRVDPARHAIVLFYFCGHGLAQGISRSAYLVPEDVPVGPDAAVGELAGRLVDVAEIDARLAPLAEHRILLVDGCRKHENEDEQLLRAAPRVGLDAGQIGGILKVLQFVSGKDGPDPMLFGGPDGQNALPVKTAWCAAGAGPLAERLRRLLDQVRDEKLSLSPAQFVQRLQVPVAVNDERDVRAYTSIRDDFVEALPRPVLFGAGSHQWAAREKPYRFDSSAAVVAGGAATVEQRAPTTPDPSGATVRRIGDIHVPSIADFAYVPGEERVYAADDSGSIWTWRSGDRERKPVKGDVPFASLLSLGNTTYLYSGSTRELYKLAPTGASRVSGGYVEFLARGAGGSSALLVENDHTVGTADAVRRLLPDAIPDDLAQCTAVVKLDTTDVQGMIEAEPGRLVYSSSTFDGSLVARGTDGKDEVLCHGLGRPGAVTEAGGFVYCVEASGMLYRRSPKGVTQRVSMADVGFGEGESARRVAEHGLQAIRPDVLWIAAGDGVFELDLTHARWQPFNSS